MRDEGTTPGRVIRPGCGMCARLEGRQFDGLDRDGGAGYLAECGSESPSLYLH